MPTKVHLATAHLREIEAYQLNLAADDAEVFVSAAIQFLQTQFDRTFKHWAKGKYRGASKYGIPTVRFNYTIKKDRKRGIDIEIHALVVAQGGGRHVLWHWLTFGTKPYKPKRNLRFPLRNKTRTKPRDLDAHPFPGFSGEWVTITPSKGRKGIEAREWYEGIYDEFKRYLARNRGMLNNKMVYFTKRVKVVR